MSQEISHQTLQRVTCSLQLLKKSFETQRPVVADLREKVKTIVQTDPDSTLADEANSFIRQFDTLLESVEVRKRFHAMDEISSNWKSASTRRSRGKISLQALEKRCTAYADEHRAYQDSYNDARDWLTQTNAKLSDCSDVRGDRPTMESKLDKAMEILAEKPTGLRLLSANSYFDLVLLQITPIRRCIF